MLLHVSDPEAPVAPSSPSSSFDALYALHGPSLVRQLHAMTGDLGEAQDCVQEAFARAWQRWSRGSPVGTVKARLSRGRTALAAHLDEERSRA